MKANSNESRLGEIFIEDDSSDSHDEKFENSTYLSQKNQKPRIKNKSIFGRKIKTTGSNSLLKNNEEDFISHNSDSGIGNKSANSVFSTNSANKIPIANKMNAFFERRRDEKANESLNLNLNTNQRMAYHKVRRIRSEASSLIEKKENSLRLETPQNTLKDFGHNSNESGNQAISGKVKYGDFIRIWANSQNLTEGGYVGTFNKMLRGKNFLGKGELFIIPLSTQSPQILYHETCFKIVDPSTEKDEGDDLLYGDQLSLVDDKGMVWNNKIGRFNGRLGPSLFGDGGHMHLTLIKLENKSSLINSNNQDLINSPPRANSNHDSFRPNKEIIEKCSPIMTKSIKTHESVRYGDKFEILCTKIRDKGNESIKSIVTHHKRLTERNVGGFLRSDGKGHNVIFQFHHAPPRITTVMIYQPKFNGSAANTHTHHKIAWNQEILFNFMPSKCNPDRRISFLKKNILGSSNFQDLPKNKPNFEESMSTISANGYISNNENEKNILVRICLSDGGELLLDSKEVLSCLNKAKWFDITDSSKTMCILIKVRNLNKSGTIIEGKMNKKKYKVFMFFTQIIFFSIMKAIFNRISKFFEKYFSFFLFEGFFIWFILYAVYTFPSIFTFFKPAEPFLIGFGFSSNEKKSTRPTPHAIKLLKCEDGLAEDQPPIVSNDNKDEQPILSKEDIPETFIIAENGNIEKAIERYQNTLNWRKEIKADSALETPHPKFFICKQYYPSCLHGRDKLGSVVYYERLGGIDVEMLKKKGIDTKLLLWHYMFQMENLWSNICSSQEDRTTTILDMKGVVMKDVQGEVLAFVKASIGMLSSHYPARSNCIFIINVPGWFSWVFRLIKPLLNEETRSKIRPCDASQYEEALKEWINDDEIPKEYGGSSKFPLFEHPWEIRLKDHVENVLKREGIEPEYA